MVTLVIFAALIYLVGHLGLDPHVTRILSVVLAIAGILLWLLVCFGVRIPACFQ